VPGDAWTSGYARTNSADRALGVAAISYSRAMSEGESEGSASTDSSASTAEFRAFARGAAEEERPWAMRASGRTVGLLAAVIVAVAVVLAVIAILVVNS
jgi:hypothetical protein